MWYKSKYQPCNINFKKEVKKKLFKFSFVTKGKLNVHIYYLAKNYVYSSSFFNSFICCYLDCSFNTLVCVLSCLITLNCTYLWNIVCLINQFVLEFDWCVLHCKGEFVREWYIDLVLTRVNTHEGALVRSFFFLSFTFFCSMASP